MKFVPSKDLWKHQVLFAIYTGAIVYMIFFFFSTKEPRNLAEQISAGILVGLDIYWAVTEVFNMIHAYMEQIKDEKTNSK
jgi:hypothetical protein